jgi:hypothetical protein
VPGRGTFVRVGLELAWAAASDNVGVEAYLLERSGTSPLFTRLPAPASSATVALRRCRSRVTLVAIDAAGNRSPAASLTLSRRARPALPQAIPRWAWKLLRWRASPAAGRGPRPATPAQIPAWYWRWAAWRLRPAGSAEARRFHTVASALLPFEETGGRTNARKRLSP